MFPILLAIFLTWRENLSRIKFHKCLPKEAILLNQQNIQVQDDSSEEVSVHSVRQLWKFQFSRKRWNHLRREEEGNLPELAELLKQEKYSLVRGHFVHSVSSMDKETSEPYRVVFILIRRFWSEYFQSQAPTKHLLLQAWLRYSFEGMCKKKSLLKLCFDKKLSLIAKSFSFQSHSFFPANSETIQCEGRFEKGPRKLCSVLVLVYLYI